MNRICISITQFRIFLFYCHPPCNTERKMERRKHFTVYIESRSVSSLGKRRGSFTHRSLATSEPTRREVAWPARKWWGCAIQDCSSIPLAAWPWASHFISTELHFLTCKMKPVRSSLPASWVCWQFSALWKVFCQIWAIGRQKCILVKKIYYNIWKEKYFLLLYK